MTKTVLHNITPRPQGSQLDHAVDRLEHDQAKAAWRQLLYERIDQDEEPVDREGEMHANRLC